MDPDVKKKVLRQISYGMYVVTANTDGAISASTVNWLSQASFSPPLVMVGVKGDSTLHEALKKGSTFAVNVLSADQKQLAEDFFRPSSVEGDKVNGHSFKTGSSGAPILDEVYSHFECKVTGSIEGGDHSVFVGEVIEAEARREDKPLEMWDTGWFYGG
jgi:flavin reductase (DIM6/NTAB) family NADH-FMN oxidoreductase RutF